MPKFGQFSKDTQTILTLQRGAVLPAFEGFADKEFAGVVSNADVWVGPTDIQPEPVTAGYQPNLISSSVDDDAGGDGVLKVEVHYIDTAGAQQDEIVTLNGQTQVLMVATDVMFINGMHTTELVGTGIAAAGNIDARNVTTVVARMALTTNLALSTMRMVPAGKMLLVAGWHCEGVAAAVKEAKIRIRSTTHREKATNQPGIYHFFDSARVKDSSSGFLHFPKPIEIQPLSTIKISAWTDGIIDLSSSWRGWLEDI